MTANQTPKPSNLQRGFSLVELMVSMLLGMFIIGGLISVFIASSQNYRVQQALSEVQDKGRYVLRVIRQSVQQSGYGLEDSDSPINATTGVTTGLSAACTTLTQSLELYWIDHSDNLSRGQCYYLLADPDNTFTLMRNTMINGAAPVAANAQALITGIEQLDYYFALDTNGDGAIDKVSGRTLQTLAQINLSAALTWSQVKGVRMEIIIASDTAQVTNGRQTLINPFNRGTNVIAINNDNRMIQPFIATFALRNRIQ